MVSPHFSPGAMLGSSGEPCLHSAGEEAGEERRGGGGGGRRKIQSGKFPPLLQHFYPYWRRRLWSCCARGRRNRGASRNRSTRVYPIIIFIKTLESLTHLFLAGSRSACSIARSLAGAASAAGGCRPPTSGSLSRGDSSR